MRRSGSGMPTCRSQSMARARAASPRNGVCATIVSTICSPMRSTGFRLVDGSWKMMPILPPRRSRMRASGNTSSSSSSSVTEPSSMRPLSGNRRINAIAVIDLPQPDSPTSANVSPRATAMWTPSSARTRPASESSATCR